MDGTFLVFVNFSIVAKDVSTTLQHLGFGTPLIATTEAEALALMSEHAQGAALRLAVVQLSPDAFSQSPLRGVLEQHRAHVILLDGSPCSHSANRSRYPVLGLPFFTTDLQHLVAYFARKS
ncbi:hypothetical protein [Roseinatronobacter sp. NSM]|uniref:hypothetical protein n=1 Tax=Roseinatronobacter sp. NSM TaxID=3457785 RepID=UPI00403529FB